MGNTFRSVLSSGGGGGGIVLTVTCSSDFVGQTISCSDGTITFNKVCPSSSPYEVLFEGLYAGTWTISGVDVNGISASIIKTVSNISGELSSVVSDLSWNDANSRAQSLVTAGTHKLCCTDFHIQTASGHDHYYSNSANISTLSYSSMTRKINTSVTYTEFDDLEVSALGDKYTFTFLKKGVITFAEVQADVNYMAGMISRGNIWKFECVNANSSIVVPRYTSGRPASTWFTYYPVVS